MMTEAQHDDRGPAPDDESGREHGYQDGQQRQRRPSAAGAI